MRHVVDGLEGVCLEGGGLAAEHGGGGGERWWAESALGVAGLVAGDGGPGAGDGREGLLGDVDDETLGRLLAGLLPRAALAAWCQPAAA